MAAIRYSKGFLYFLLADQVPDGFEPKLLIVDYKLSGPNGARMRIFDGFFRYNHCFIGKATLDTHPEVKIGTVIQVTSYRKEDNVGKWFFYFDDFVILAENQDTNIRHEHLQGDAENFTQIVQNEGLRLEMEDSIIQEAPSKRLRFDSSVIQIPNSTNNSFTRRSTTNNVTKPSPIRLSTSRSCRTFNVSSVIPDPTVTPISLLTPYVNKWRICGVCTSREALRTVNTKAGPAKVFSFELADESRDCIKISAWKDVAEALDQQIVVHGVYYIAGEGCVRPKNASFNSTNHDFEMSLTAACKVEPCTDKAIAVPALSLKRARISDIPSIFQANSKATIDLLAVADKVGESQPIFSSRKNVEYVKREVTLVDESNCSVSLVLWEEHAENLEFEEGQILALKGLAVNEFNGGLSVGKAVRMEVNPNTPGVTALANWYPHRQAERISSISVSHTSVANMDRDLRTLTIVKEANMADKSVDGKGVYFYCVAMIVEALRDNNVTYPACTTCNKKVILSEQGGYNCTKCGIQGGAQFRHRYLLTLRISDTTGEVYVTLFDEQARDLLGYAAEDLSIVQRDNNPEYQNVFQSIMFKTYLFKLKVAAEFYQDQRRVKFTCLAIRTFSYGTYMRILDAGLAVLESL